MADHLKKAIAVLDMDLTLSAIETADDASLRKFFSLSRHWLELTNAELEKRNLPLVKGLHLKPREELVPSRGLNYAEIRLIANDIGDELWHRAKLGKISKIGIDEIHDAIRERAGSFKFEHPDGAEHLEQLTTRRIIEKV